MFTFRFPKLSKEEGELIELYRAHLNNKFSHSVIMNRVRDMFSYQYKYDFWLPKTIAENDLKHFAVRGAQSGNSKSYYGFNIPFKAFQETHDLSIERIENLDCTEVFVNGENITRYVELKSIRRSHKRFEFLMNKPFHGNFELYFKEKAKVDTV